MTTPLGTLDVTGRGTRRVSVSRRTRETEIDVSLDLDGSGAARISTGVGFYDHLLTSLAHHGLFDLEIRATGDLEVDEHHTVEDVALVLGSAFAEALGDRAGIRRFGEASVPMDESLATAVIDVGGRPYAVIDLPFRGERVGGLPLQLVEHALEAFARTAGATLHVRGTGRNDHHLAEAAFKALARALREACESDPRRDGVASTKGSLGMTRPTRPRIAVVDYGAGNLVSIEQALTASGAEVVDRPRPGDHSRAPMRSSCPASAPPRPRWTASATPASSTRSSAGSPADRPFLGICLGLQLLFEASDEDGAQTLGVLPGRTRRLEDAPTLPHIGWNQVERRRDHPLFEGIADGADFYFVHSYAGAPAETRRRRRPRRDRARRARSFRAVARGNLLGVQFHPERSGDDGLRLLANFVVARASRRTGRRRRGVLMLRRRVIPCLDVADGRVVKGTRFVDLVDEGDPPELAERYAREGADELVFLDITAAPERRGTLLDIVERTARRAFIPLTVGGGVRSVDEMRDVLRAGADKVSLNTAAVAEPELDHARAPRRFGSQAVVVAIDAASSRRRRRWEVVVKGGREATGSMPSRGPSAPSSSGPASCWSPRSTATGPGSASTPSCSGRSPIA